MAFVKVIAPGAYQFLEKQAQLIKSCRDGSLRGNDFRALIKRAGHQFADAFNRIKLASGEVPIHLLAIGATEDYGPNRNGDGFSRGVCNKYHPTFVKYSRWYRNHANKDPQKSYGVVKLSAFNKEMKRIELLVALNGSKEASSRNGGLVADEELEKLARGEDIGVSMACRVPFDVCSACGNKAKSRDEYCTSPEEGGLCKAGGLKNNITAVLEDGSQLYADNTEPTFFDISKVWRPADRIAYVTGQMKAASGSILSGAALAEEWGVTAPWNVGDNNKVAALVEKLAAVERRLSKTGFQDGYTPAFCPAVQGTANWSEHHVKVAEALRALCLCKVCPTLEGFLILTTGDPVKSAAVADVVQDYLPGVFSRLSTGEVSADLETYFGENKLPPRRARSWAEGLIPYYGLSKKAVLARARCGALYPDEVPSPRACLTKTAGSAEEMARTYAAFQLAWLDAQPRDDEFDLTCEMLVRQNYL